MDLLDTTPLSSQDVPKLAAIATVTFIFFWIMYIITYGVMSMWKSNKIYQELAPEKKADYVSRIVANIHAVIAVYMAVVILF